MAYNAEGETSKKIADIQRTEKEYVRVTKIANKSGEHIDLRIMYVDKETGELGYTSRGIRFQAGLLPDIMTALQQAKEVNMNDDETAGDDSSEAAQTE